jgi:hypothetical protein
MTHDNRTVAPLPAAPNAPQIEHALESALKAGRHALSQQIRYVLALSQQHNARPETYRDRPLTVPQARLAALVESANALPTAQVERLYAELRLLPEADVRLELQSRLLAYLTVAEQNPRAREIWSQIEQVSDAVVTIRVMLRIADLPAPPLELDPEASPLVRVMALANKMRSAEARVRTLAALADHAPPHTAALLYKNILAVINQVPNDALRSTTIVALTRHAPTEFEAQIIEAARGITRAVHRARALIAVAQAFPERVDLKNDALTVIARIDNEDDKAEMLVNLAAYLQRVELDQSEYPETLQRALAILLDINKRTLRARVLVALAPLMTRDLQLETLAAVNGLPAERERALLLAELVHALPPELLVASLAVAHTLREQDARVHALGVLAHYVPEQARNQTILDAFAAASNLPNHYERVVAVIALVDVLPEHMRGQAFTNALEAARLIDNENARSRALSQIGHHLPGELVQRALEFANAIQSPEMRLAAVASLVSRLDDAVRIQHVSAMLDLVRQIPLDYKRARALSSIAPHVAVDFRAEAGAIIATLTDPLDGFNAYLALLQNTPPDQRAPLAKQGWDLLPRIEDAYDRAGALVALAPYLGDDYRDRLQDTALQVVLSIEDDYDRASAITLLASIFGDNPYGEAASPLPDAHTLTVQAIKAAVSIPYQNARLDLLRSGVYLWLKLNENQQYGLWKDIARRLKSLPVADVLLSLGVMLPVLESLGGEGTIRKIAQALGLNSVEK